MIRQLLVVTILAASVRWAEPEYGAGSQLSDACGVARGRG